MQFFGTRASEPVEFQCDKQYHTAQCVGGALHRVPFRWRSWPSALQSHSWFMLPSQETITTTCLAHVVITSEPRPLRYIIRANARRITPVEW